MHELRSCVSAAFQIADGKTRIQSVNTDHHRSDKPISIVQRRAGTAMEAVIAVHEHVAELEISLHFVALDMAAYVD